MVYELSDGVMCTPITSVGLAHWPCQGPALEPQRIGLESVWSPKELLRGLLGPHPNVLIRAPNPHFEALLRPQKHWVRAPTRAPFAVPRFVLGGAFEAQENCFGANLGPSRALRGPKTSF